MTIPNNVIQKLKLSSSSFEIITSRDFKIDFDGFGATFGFDGDPGDVGGDVIVEARDDVDDRRDDVIDDVDNCLRD